MMNWISGNTWFESWIIGWKLIFLSLRKNSTKKWNFITLKSKSFLIISLIVRRFVRGVIGHFVLRILTFNWRILFAICLFSLNIWLSNHFSNWFFFKNLFIKFEQISVLSVISVVNMGNIFYFLFQLPKLFLYSKSF